MVTLGESSLDFSFRTDTSLRRAPVYRGSTSYSDRPPLVFPLQFRVTPGFRAGVLVSTTLFRPSSTSE